MKTEEKALLALFDAMFAYEPNPPGLSDEEIEMKKNVHGILPCPFCGSDRVELVRDDRLRLLCVECRSCKIAATTPDDEETVDAWNRRTPPKDPK